MTAHSTRAHARLAPSAASRWFACPGSIRRSEGIADEGSVYAAEGTAAHELAEHCLRHGYNAERFLGKFISSDSGEIQTSRGGAGWFEITRETADAVQVYLDYCREQIKPGDDYEFEVKLRYDERVNGTADFVRYRPATGELVIADYKHGRGVAVEAIENKQALVYGLMKIKALGNRPVSTVTFTIVQPRAPGGGVKEWTIPVLDMLDFEADLLDAVVATEDPNAPLRAGAHCRFCPAAPVCEEYAREALAAAQAEFGPDGAATADPLHYSPAELAEKLKLVPVVEQWCKAVLAFAHAEAEQGRMPPGFKLVAKRATRKWTDDALALGWLRSQGVENPFSQPELISPAAAEKALREANPGLKQKDAKAQIEASGIVESVSGGTVLAPEDDPRPNARVSAAEEFAV